MTSVDDLVQNVVDTMDTAHSQRANLTELLGSIEDAKKQVTSSASLSKKKVRGHFDSVQKQLCDMLAGRMAKCLAEIDELEQHNLEPLTQCEDMINAAIEDATHCMEQGKTVLENAPEDNTEMLLKFKDSSETKNFNILPEVPSLYEVANIDVSFHDDVCEGVRGLVLEDGIVYERAPVQVTELSEVPGGLLVRWDEIDDNVDAGEFRLQYCSGKALAWNLAKTTFQTAYTGPAVSHLVTKLRANQSYSFRVCCRADKDVPWSVWSVPRTASTRLAHYQWQSGTPGYCTSAEDKVGTRATDLTRVLYSQTPCYKSGYRLTFRILATGERSPFDGLGISVTSEDIETMKREGAAFLGTDGAMYVDGQEMKTKLPNLSRNSTVTIETETLPNGKVRVSVQVEEKELTFDWNISRQVALGAIGGTGLASFDNSGQSFYFAMIFSHEDWKVLVE